MIAISPDAAKLSLRQRSNAWVLLSVFAVVLASAAQAPLFAQDVYYPPPGTWARAAAEAVGMDPEGVQAAIDFAIAHESSAPRDLEQAHYLSFGTEPFGDAIGPHKARGKPTGLIIRNGYVVAQWGEPDRVDMTFSVTKTFLSSTVGLAYDRGLIRDVHDQVHPYMAPVSIISPYPTHNRADELGTPKVYEPFASEHSQTITWDHLLRQTSDWEGTLWGKPDWADRPRGDSDTWLNRPRNAPGTTYKYNDVRVNVLALAIMNVWRQPLPQVLKTHFMDPIGASHSWRWHGYENSWVLMDGLPMQAVSGGGHWGGGMFINAWDQARMGYLTLRRGKWKDQQILSEEWVSMALTPTEVRPTYGFMNWFLNTEQELIPQAPATAFAHLGAGTNMVYVDPEHELVVVARWIDRSAMNEFVARVLEAIE